MTCLREDDVISFVAGSMSAENLTAAEMHLDQCRNCRLLVSTFAAQTGDRGHMHTPLCAFAPGESLAGRYRINALLGAGGMGEVYAALDTVLGETVALKTMAVGIPMDETGAARLKAEVQLARRVTHPNVCRVFDVGFHRPDGDDPGQLGPGIPFFTMELLQGETLGARLRRAGPFAVGDALSLLEQIAAGVDAAHRAGIIHADLKSDNVMLIPDAAGNRCVITDFGLARRSDGRSLRLHDGVVAVAGTMGYMAPEQIEGRAATPAADIYALGVVLFEMVSGRLPRESRPPAGGAQTSEPWIPPALQTLGVVAPAAWDAALIRCLDPAPDRRFPCASALCASLRAALPAPRGASRPAAGRQARRFTLVVGAAVAVAVTIAVSMARAPVGMPLPPAAHPQGAPSFPEQVPADVTVPAAPALPATTAAGSSARPRLFMRSRAPSGRRQPPARRSDEVTTPVDPGRDPGKDRAIDPFSLAGDGDP